jgi:hypothetical protein
MAMAAMSDFQGPPNLACTLLRTFLERPVRKADNLTAICEPIV